VVLHGLPFVRWLLLGSCRVFYFPGEKREGQISIWPFCYFRANKRGRRSKRPTPSQSRRIKESGAPAQTVNDILLSFITIDDLFGSGRDDTRRILRQRRRV